MDGDEDPPGFHELGPGRRIAYRFRGGRAPTLLFLSGYASDMEGAKALALAAFARQAGIAMLRLDYSGTGRSSGRFEDGTLELWLEEALAVADAHSEGPLVVVGSSMGGWLALHLALRRPERVRAIVGIAAAPDFTEWGYRAEERRTLVATGRLEQPNPYGDAPQLTTRAFWESGQRMRLLEGDPIAIDCPVRLIHGDADADVPLDVAVRLMQKLRSADVQLTILKGGGHRLSEPRELDAILRAVEPLVEP